MALPNPAAFVEYVLSFVLRVVEVTANSQDGMPCSDNIWYNKIYGEGHRASDKLLHFLEKSLSEVAATSPEELSETINKLLSKSDFETAQYLLIRTYAANGERFANHAVDYLCEKPYRLKTGYSICNGNSLAAPYWATRQMLEAITPYCSTEKLRELETLLLSYYPSTNEYPDYQYMISRLKLYGYEQFVLLDAIASNRRSNAAHRRLQEWRRKFISAELLKAPGIIEPPTSIEAYSVGSPIPEDAASKMSDKQWLEALQKYNEDKDGRRFRREGKFTGGAWALSSVLEHQTKKDPIRFSKLTQQFPDTFDSCYFDAVLRGVAEVGVDVETATNLCQRCDQLPHKPCGQSISWLVRKLAHLSWSEEIYSIVLWYATQDPNPEQRRNAQTLRDLESLALNSVRGSAVAAIADLIFTDKNRTTYFRPCLEQIVRDPSPAVRSHTAEVLTAVLNFDRDLAVRLFLELCDADEIILGTRTVEKFLRYALHTHFDLLEPIIKRMLHSEISEAIEVGAQKSCVMSLIVEQAKPLADYCLSATTTHQLSAAKVFAHNVRSAHFRQFGEAALAQLFHNSDEKVRAQASKCFFRMEGEELSNYLSLVHQFIQSPAFTTEFHNLVWALERTTAKLPETIYLLCDRYIQALVDRTALDGKIFRVDIDSISQLLVKAYSQSSRNQKLQTQCLDLIDRLVMMGTYGLNKALEQYER